MGHINASGLFNEATGLSKGSGSMCSEPPNDSSRAPSAPKFFRLPKAGETDPHFSLGRLTYLRLEQAGALTLTRVTMPGKDRGSVLVETEQVLKYLRELAAEKLN